MKRKLLAILLLLLPFQAMAQTLPSHGVPAMPTPPGRIAAIVAFSFFALISILTILIIATYGIVVLIKTRVFKRDLQKPQFYILSIISGLLSLFSWLGLTSWVEFMLHRNSSIPFPIIYLSFSGITPAIFAVIFGTIAYKKGTRKTLGITFGIIVIIITLFSLIFTDMPRDLSIAAKALLSYYSR